MAVIVACIGIVEPKILKETKSPQLDYRKENLEPHHNLTAPFPTTLSPSHKTRRKRGGIHTCVTHRLPRGPPSEISSQDSPNKQEGPIFTPCELNGDTNRGGELANHTQLPTPHKKRQEDNSRGEITTKVNPPPTHMSKTPNISHIPNTHLPSTKHPNKKHTRRGKGGWQ